jgi:hypothetical protein
LTSDGRPCDPHDAAGICAAEKHGAIDVPPIATPPTNHRFIGES